MTPKKKAEELLEKYKNNSTIWIDENDCFINIKQSKEASLIAVDELIKQSMDNEYSEKYWKQVKEEITKL